MGKKNSKNPKKSSNSDLEKEWRKMRRKLELKLDSDSKEKDENKEENDSESSGFSFEQFVPSAPSSNSGSSKSRSVVLKKVENLENLGEENDFESNLNVQTNPNTGSENWRNNIIEGRKGTVEYVANSRKGGGNFYFSKERSRTMQPPVLSPREMLPPEEFTRQKLVDPSTQMAWQQRSGPYPDKLVPESEEAEEKYYKSPEDSY